MPSDEEPAARARASVVSQPQILFLLAHLRAREIDLGNSEIKESSDKMHK